ncbi:shematrin-like protein 1 [Episyrphus balteatus]|uniref:shematrin-like protein 1 n=1 Tax=Episyrphus balteatus TaxID=286459 RepID=UPI0024867FBF|nr:shematrin-like protein 1 [Episyrphus balteatus]
MFKFFSFWVVIALLVFLTTSTSGRPQSRRQLLDKRVENREQESEDLDAGADDKDDLKGSASIGYGYYGGYPYGGYGGGLYSGGLYGGSLYGGGIYPYSYSLSSGYYGAGYYPHYGGYGGFPGHYF